LFLNESLCEEEQMNVLTLFDYLIVAISLSLATGIYAFVPILVLGVVSHLGPVQFPHAEWLGHPGVILVLSCALIFEILADMLWGVSHAIEVIVAPVMKPAVAALLAVTLLGPDVGTAVAAIAMGAVPAAVTQLSTLTLKWTIRCDPATNVVCAIVGLVVSLAVATWAVAIYPSTSWIAAH
jgi:hypothetical protein